MIKKVGDGATDPDCGKGQVSWNKTGGPEMAWTVAKKRANFL